MAGSRKCMPKDSERTISCAGKYWNKGKMLLELGAGLQVVGGVVILRASDRQ